MELAATLSCDFDGVTLCQLVWEAHDDWRVSCAFGLRHKGQELANAGNCKAAVRSYTLALSLLDSMRNVDRVERNYVGALLAGITYVDDSGLLEALYGEAKELESPHLVEIALFVVAALLDQKNLEGATAVLGEAHAYGAALGHPVVKKQIEGLADGLTVVAALGPINDLIWDVYMKRLPRQA